MTSFDTLTVLFTREDTFRISNAAILTVTLDAQARARVLPSGDKPPALAETQERVLDLLEAALSRWIEQTAEGQAVWKASCEDLNIGDMATYGLHKDPTLTAYLAEQGITILSLNTLSDMAHVEFDRILASPDL